MNGQEHQETAPGPGEIAAKLAALREHAVELLAQLDRPPRNIRIQAGMITVDITWPDGVPEPAGQGGQHRAPSGSSGKDDDGAAGEYLTAPMVGVFYHSREPGAPPFVSVGSVVEPGQQVGIIEAMKLMIPVEADRAGIIMAVLKGNGESVEYGEPLFALEAEEGSA